VALIGRRKANRRNGSDPPHAAAWYNPPGWACSTAVSAGDSSIMVPSRGNARSGRDEFRETFERVALMAILSRAAGTPAEGAETTWGLECP
jgi:hypothetical protein